MIIELTKEQIEFISRACNLEEHVINYDETDSEFKRFYGCSKNKMRAEVNKLYLNL